MPSPQLPSAPRKSGDCKKNVFVGQQGTVQAIMILSERYGFLFIKTTKTAGTSIEVDLSARVEGDAIVTPIEPAVAGHVPRNFRSQSGATFYNHMPATLIRSEIGDEFFSHLFKFCVEREPVTKCISHFHMQHARGLVATWDDYVAQRRFPIDTSKYAEMTPDGPRIVVDRILRYENIHEELPGLMSKLGMSGFALVSRAKSEFSANKLVRETNVTDAQRKVILQAFAGSLKVHGLYGD
jgi:hypothetical protein